MSDIYTTDRRDKSSEGQARRQIIQKLDDLNRKMVRRYLALVAGLLIVGFVAADTYDRQLSEQHDFQVRLQVQRWRATFNTCWSDADRNKHLRMLIAHRRLSPLERASTVVIFDAAFPPHKGPHPCSRYASQVAPLHGPSAP